MFDYICKDAVKICMRYIFTKALIILLSGQQKLCKACLLLEGLNRGLPKLGIGRSRGLDSVKKDGKERTLHSGVKGSNLQSKQCGTLDF